MGLLTPRRASAALLTAGVMALSLVSAPSASAATLSRSALSVTVNGNTVTANTTVYASPSTWSTEAGICARSASDEHYDFPKSAVTLRSNGTTFTKTRTFPAGTYTYWACAQIDGRWTGVGARQTFTVGSSTPAQPPAANTGTTTGTASGQSMPTGDLPGWKQVFADDFSTSVSGGSFPGPYASKWSYYDGFYDTFGTGYYDRSAISVHDGMMDLHLRTENGRPIAAAPVPMTDRGWRGQTYGRYSVRFKSDRLPGYKAAWLLWPASNVWNEGEIDFPEGGLDENMWGFNHCKNNPRTNCYWLDTKTSFNDWHTATIEWSPGRINYILDGKTMGTTTNSVPTTPMNWILQTETGGSRPASNVNGHLLIDWVTIHTWNG